MISYSALLGTLRVLAYYARKPSLNRQLVKHHGQAQFVLLAAEAQFKRASRESVRTMATLNPDDPAKSIGYEQLIKKQKNEAAVVVDVREPDELATTGVIPGSINIPLGGIEQALQLTPDAFRSRYGAEKPSKDALIIFSCRSGKRSNSALSKALAHGFNNAVHYSGGWLDWEHHIKQNS